MKKVLNIIRSLDANKAHGCDNISISMIKICDSAVMEPLCMIYEKCLETGFFPTSWKRANVIPVHKKNCRQSSSNYRPISILPIFVKIFEKLLFDAIYKHLYGHSLITPHQSGFHPGDSIINQLLSITREIYTAFEDMPSRETRAVFLDLSKVFGMVWHSGLLYKLGCNGICSNLLGIIQDFLHECKQRLVLNGKSSNWSAVSASVPQCSVLGPLFFIAHINDLPENLSCGGKVICR